MLAPDIESQNHLKQLRNALKRRSLFRDTHSYEAPLRELVLRSDLGVVRDLLAIALENQGTERAALLRAAATLCEPILPRFLVALDDWLRRVGSWSGVWADGWRGIAPRDVAALAVDAPAEQLLVGLLASHAQGRIREAAVVRLSATSAGWALPFLLVRANDWVPEVRIRARTALLQQLTPEHAEQLLECLPLFDWLARAQRTDQRDLMQAFDRALQAEASRPTLVRALRDSDVRVRRRCFRLAATALGVDRSALLTSAVTDHDTVIRRWAYSLIPDVLPESEQLALFDRALDDPFTRVRRLAYDFWRDREGAAAQRIRESFLFDQSAALREDARRAWDARETVSALELYRRTVKEGTAVRLVSALYGIGETGSPDDESIASQFVKHPRARVRQAALRALCRLSPSAAIEPFVLALLTDTSSVSTEAGRCLRKRKSELSAEHLWTRARDAPDERRTRVLMIIGQLGKWEHLRYLLLAADDPKPVVSAFAVARLEVWIERLNRSAVAPSTATLDALRAHLARHRENLPSSLAAEIMFIVERA